MLELLDAVPYKIIAVFITFMLLMSYFMVNFNNKKYLLMLVVFYIPISFVTQSGSTAVYLSIALWLMSFLDIGERFSLAVRPYLYERISIVAILLLSVVTFFTSKDSGIVYYVGDKIRLTNDFLMVVAMLSNFALFSMLIKYIDNIEDLISIIRYIVLSGFIGSMVSYLQLADISAIVKYIVVAENPVWSTRVAGTMPGYECLSEYIAILCVFSFILIYFTKNNMERFFYYIIIINFMVVLVLTQTRGIFIAGILAILYTFGLLCVLGRIRAVAKYAIISLFSCLIIFGIIITSDKIRKSDTTFMDRIIELKDINIQKGEYGTRTGSWRWGHITIGRMKLPELLFGSGYKYFMESLKTEGYMGWPHCLYYSYIIRNGIISFMVFALLLIVLYWKSLMSIVCSMRLNNNGLFFLAICLHFILVLFIINEAKIEFIRHDRSENTTWVFLSIIAIGSSIIRSMKYDLSNISSRYIPKSVGVQDSVKQYPISIS
jgi:hypothetical protein